MTSFTTVLVFAALIAGHTNARAGDDPMPKTVAPLSCSNDQAPNGNPSTCECPPGYKYSWRNPGVCHYHGQPKHITKGHAQPKYAEATNCATEETIGGKSVHCDCPPGYVYVRSDGERCVNLTPDPLDVTAPTVDDDGRKHHQGFDGSDESDSKDGSKSKRDKTPAR